MYTLFLQRVRVRTDQRAFVFRFGELTRLLGPGAHVLPGTLFGVRVDTVDVREVALTRPFLDAAVRKGVLGTEARILDLADHERALVWVDGRFHAVLQPGLHVLWTVLHDVVVERVDARGLRLESSALASILASPSAREALDVYAVEAGQVGLLFRDGALAASLGSGTYAFWKGTGRYRLVVVDLKEQVLDVNGQEIMTADKVTLRLNAVVTYRVTDALTAVMAVDDVKQALYREAQLALREAIGTRELDVLLAEKDGISRVLVERVSAKARDFGVVVTGLGIRDVVLPGEMKDLLNKVTEARKASEAALITRREETAAMRMQANTAKLLEGNPTLMRLRELEVLEKVAAKAKLSVVLGEKGLADTVVRIV